MQAYFDKSDVYLPLPTLYKCTNLKVVKAFVYTALDKVMVQSYCVSLPMNERSVQLVPFGFALKRLGSVWKLPLGLLCRIRYNQFTDFTKSGIILVVHCPQQWRVGAGGLVVKVSD